MPGGKNTSRQLLGLLDPIRAVDKGRMVETMGPIADHTLSQTLDIPQAVCAD